MSDRKITSLLNKIKARTENYIWSKRRVFYTKKLRKMIDGKSIPTIFSCNCTGGVMYHDLGCRFLSPTVNLYMSCSDFIKFCENYKYYCSLELYPYKGKIIRDYPIGVLGDITLFFVHYHSFDEAKQKWKERTKRINEKNIRVIATDRDGCTEEIKDRFEKLPYKKVMFTHLPDLKHKNCFYVSGFEKDPQVGTVIDHDGKISGKRYYDQFDWVTFLTEDNPYAE